MARAQSQFLRIHDSAGTTYQRWQNFYAHQTVTWSSASWIYQPFSASGITSGQTGDESGVTINVPATPIVVDVIERAMANSWLFTLQAYQFDAYDGLTAPLATQTLVATFTGEVVDAGGTLTELQIELGSSLSPVGAQIPPRTMTTRLIGKGCRL
jgi:hypothetical protein